jgi:hypothetical protein
VADLTFHVLVVANRTAGSAELAAALAERAERSRAEFTLLLPVSPATSHEEGQATLDEAVGALRERGLTVDGELGFGEPLEVFQEAWDARRFDEVIVSTLSGATSKWLQIDLPHHIARLTGVQVTHVVSMPPRKQPAGGPPPAHEKPALGPLSVLSWGGRRSRE